jgi:NitT/TauT family transport system permease protein
MSQVGDKRSLAGRLAPFLGIAALIVAWDLALRLHSDSLLPRPFAVASAIAEMAGNGWLVRHLVASLFRVTWGYLGAVLLAVPVGISLGLYRRPAEAVVPMLELLRPISPLAWIPIAILWLGVGDLAAVALIFLASFLPLTLALRNGVHGVPDVHVQAGRNFGLTSMQLARRVIFPSLLPELIVGLRLSLGIAWLVVVAAEMIAVNSGLGFLIVDARNAGDRYDLVVAGMALIGLVGLFLDLAIRRLERLPAVRWRYVGATA